MSLVATLRHDDFCGFQHNACHIIRYKSRTRVTKNYPDNSDEQIRRKQRLE